MKCIYVDEIIEISMFDPQLFAAGEVVHGTEGYVNAGAGTTDSYGGGGLSAELKTYYDKLLIELAGANLVHDQFAEKRPIPPNNGKTIEFRRFSSLPKASALIEGVTPQGNKLTVTTVTSTVSQYGDYIEFTDMLDLTAIDNNISQAVKKLSDQAGRTLDSVTRNELHTGLSAFFAPKKNADGTYTTFETREDLVSGCSLSVRTIKQVVAHFKAMNVPKNEGCYIAIVHPYAHFDLSEDQHWKDVNTYASAENQYKGELGMIEGVRFVESSEAKVFGPAVIADGFRKLTVKTAVNASTKSVVINEELESAAFASNPVPVYVGGVENTIVAIEKGNGQSQVTLGTAVTSLAVGDIICGKGGTKDGLCVFSTLMFGSGAYGTTDVTGGGLEMIVKPRGAGNDPLNQRSTVGWKATKTAEILIPEYITRIESVSELDSAATPN